MATRSPGPRRRPGGPVPELRPRRRGGRPGDAGHPRLQGSWLPGGGVPLGRGGAPGRAHRRRPSRCGTEYRHVSRRTPAHSTLLLSRALGAGRLAWSAAPGPAAATIALAVLTGAIPVASGWCLKVLLDELVHGRAANVTLVEIAAAGLAVAAVVIAVATNVAVYVATLTRRRLRVTIQERLFDRVNAFPGLAPFEDPVFLDRLRLAEDAGQRVPEEVLSSAINLMRNGVQLLGFLLTLLAIWPPVLAVLAVAAIPTILLQLALGRRRAQLAADIAAGGHQGGVGGRRLGVSCRDRVETDRRPGHVGVRRHRRAPRPTRHLERGRREHFPCRGRRCRGHRRRCRLAGRHDLPGADALRQLRGADDRPFRRHHVRPAAGACAPHRYRAARRLVPVRTG